MSITNLEFMTFTGADDGTDIDALVAFQKNHTRGDQSLCEIALLFHPEKTGQPRFPHREWIDRYLDRARGGHRTALHLCGPAIDQFLRGDPDLLVLAARFGRVQLNIFAHLYTLPFTSAQVDDAAATYQTASGGRVIVPMNEGNAAWVTKLANPDIQFLYDGSAGAGALARTWPAGTAARFEGYAGGLGPDNIAAERQKIEQVAIGPYWLDAETNLRTPGPTGPRHTFSIAACQTTIEQLGWTSESSF